jgi:hypothetical protein
LDAEGAAITFNQGFEAGDGRISWGRDIQIWDAEECSEISISFMQSITGDAR